MGPGDLIIPARQAAELHSQSLLLAGAAPTLPPNTVILIAVAAALFLACAILLVWRHARHEAALAESAKGEAAEPVPAAASNEKAAEDEANEFLDESTDRVDVREHLAAIRAGVKVPPASEAKKAEENGDFSRAATLWRARGDFAAEQRALSRTGDHARLAELKLALGELRDAIPHLREALGAAPSDERIRLTLIQALIDEGQRQEARQLARVVSPEDAPVTVSPDFFASAARAFESAGDFETALRLYSRASANEAQAERHAPRVFYIRHLMRLAETEPIHPSEATGELMEKALADADSDFLRDLSSTETRKLNEERHEESGLRLKPHEIIVGHLALGGLPTERVLSVRSIASSASRFEPGSMVGERPLSVVFAGTDKLLDSPVAIRLVRVSTSNGEYELLRDRLIAIAHLSHPNVSKITYADRYGPVVRVVTEYHAGGNLKSLVGRLNKLGLPLSLRLLIQVCAGLEEAHGHGIIHGDLRAENIMLGHDNLIKIVDFALKPWPVRTGGEATADTSGARPEETESQTDIAQFADVLEYMATNTVIAPHLAQQLGDYNPMQELAELVKSAQEGKIPTIAEMRKRLTAVFERSAPQPANS